MSDTADIFHHGGLITHNMGETITQYERLGFSFAPLSEPRIVLEEGREPETLGVGNRHAIFQDNYLEILAVTDAERWATISTEQRGSYDVSRPLARYEGFHVMHFGTDDLDAVHRRLMADGVACSDIHPFQRMVETTDGPQMMRARSIGFPSGANPEGLIQIAQHLTPELVLQPRYQHHPNGATRLTEITVCVEDPGEVADKYRRYTGHAVEKLANLYTVNLGRSRVRITSPDNLSDIVPGANPPSVPSLVGFTVSVADLQETKKLLISHHISFTEEGEMIHVEASNACGSTVAFEQDV
jgi:Glyoxalase-like domain